MTFDVRFGFVCALLVTSCGAPDASPVTPDTPPPERHPPRLGPVEPGPAPIIPIAPPEAVMQRRAGWRSSSSPQLAPIASPSLDARLLVVSADGHEPALAGIRQTLDYLGAPYTVWIATEHVGGLTAAALAEGSVGRFQGVILTSGALIHSPDGVTWTSALSPAEWQALWDYEAAFGVRQVTLYTWPTADFGFGAATGQDTSAAPVTATLTTAGTLVFSAMNTLARVPVRGVYAYLAPPATGAGVTPLLVDADGHALAVLKTWSDGRQNIALTFDSNARTVHSLALGHGLVNWVTRGVFLGERHVYASAHVDDIFVGNALWGGGVYRMTGLDLELVHEWQQGRRGRRATADFRLDLVFVGRGAEGIYPEDSLTPMAQILQHDFKWVNHTYTHLALNTVTYEAAHSEVSNNIAAAGRLMLPGFDARCLVTGEVSGLANPAAMQAAHDAGVRFIVSDTSRVGGDSPTPNTGRYNALVEDIFEIPRRPTNLYFNVSTPTEWISEYNEIYRAFSIASPGPERSSPVAARY